MMFCSRVFMLPRNIFAVTLLLSSAAAAEPAAGTPNQESAASRLAASRDHADKEQIAKRLESVQHLLETSASARQIEASKNPQAIALREDARGLYNSARAAYNEGALQKAGLLLDETSKVMFKAVGVAAPESVTARKVETDFKLRLQSVDALLAAYKRIATEKPDAKGIGKIIAHVEKSLSEATKLADAGKYAEGRAELDRAYVSLKSGVRGLREGDTLVRSLDFASKEEEYRYELDRNDTHQMLITMLLEERRAASPELSRQVSTFVGRAKELRAKAEASAAAKDFADAIKLLEDSTTELVKAIRNAGVFIPG